MPRALTKQLIWQGRSLGSLAGGDSPLPRKEAVFNNVRNNNQNNLISNMDICNKLNDKPFYNKNKLNYKTNNDCFNNNNSLNNYKNDINNINNNKYINNNFNELKSKGNNLNNDNNLNTNNILSNKYILNKNNKHNKHNKEKKQPRENFKNTDDNKDLNSKISKNPENIVINSCKNINNEHSDFSPLFSK